MLRLRFLKGAQLVASMAETAGTPARSIKVIDNLELRLNYFGKDHLGDPHAACHGKNFFCVIDQNDLDLAAVIGIDRAGGVEERNAVFDRQPAPGTDLRLKMFGKRNNDPRGHQNAVPRAYRDGFLTSG